ncbi:hypothetical protein [Bifidobacterium moukalabense]|uniref:hypothetical protein n=1 Tax=Bifidobacterium moukalabense TaxID=1333651 RepID=UPI0010F7A158|nr:hypothetical protein [Bifidobacterium moukalabense]
MFGKNNKSVPESHDEDVMTINSYDDLLAGDVFVGKNGEAYEVDVIRNENHTVGSPAMRNAWTYNANFGGRVRLDKYQFDYGKRYVGEPKTFGTYRITTRTGEEYIILCYPSGGDMGRSYAFLDENGVIQASRVDDAITRQIPWDAVKEYVDSGIIRIVRFDSTCRE